MIKPIKSITEKLIHLEGMIFNMPVSDKEIDDFEKKNNIYLPLLYRSWLKFSDGGELYLPGGIQLYGISHAPLIDVNCNDRPNDNYIVIGSLASGDPILYKKGSEEISIYNQDAGRIEKGEIFDNFYQFLCQLDEILGIEG